jgi:hypothetical protein
VARHALGFVVVSSLVALTAGEMGAQSVLTGVVRDSVTRLPIADVEILIRELKVRARTDNRGRFFLEEIGGGRFPVVARKVGYDSVSATLSFSGADSASHDFEMAMRAQPLPEVPVRGKGATLGNAKLAIFEQRRERGIGHFLTEADFARDPNHLMGDILWKLPGVRIVRSRRTQAACVGTSRGTQSFIATAIASCFGTAVACPAAVYLDGALVYAGMPGQDAFDVNSLQPSAIAGVEYYAGPAQMPPELNATRGTCGALVIWTK